MIHRHAQTKKRPSRLSARCETRSRLRISMIGPLMTARRIDVSILFETPHFREGYGIFRNGVDRSRRSPRSFPPKKAAPNRRSTVHTIAKNALGMLSLHL